MMDVAFFLVLAAIAIVLLALPFLRRQGVPVREAFDLAVHRDQLAELERDVERGVIDEEAARGARLEIERRILAAVGDGSPSDMPPAGSRVAGRSLAAALAVLIVPLGSAGLYIWLGTPEMRDLPLAARPAPEQQLDDQDALIANIEQLERHLETTPDNGGVWMVLGRTRLRAGLYQEAIEAFRKGVALSHDDPTMQAELGEAMVYAAGGQVTPAAIDQFRTVLETVPNDPRSRYYIGMALAQEGEVDAALDGWRQLLEVSPSDAPWRQQIVQAIESMLEAEGRSAEDVIADLPQGTAPQGDAADAGDDGLQAEQIRSMVEGLAARLENESDDIEGWLMLGRSRLVLEEPELAKEAFSRARKLAPERPDVLLGYAASLLKPSETPGGDPVVTDEAAAIYEKLLTLSPDDPEPRWLLGLAAAQAGDKEGAIGHWRDLLELIEDGSGDREIVEARIAALESDEPAATLAAGAPSLAPAAVERSAPEANGSTTRSDSGPAETRPVPGPSDEDRAAMAALSPEERSGRIRSMVDGLAARLEDDPSDIEGWLRLAQSRTVLGEADAAKDAYRLAMEQAPENADVIRAYAASLLGAPHPETEVATVGDEAEGLYRKILELKPDDPEAHWYLGLAAVQDGTIGDAKSHWRRVLDILGPDHPNYAAVQSSLEQVETKTQ